MCESVPGFLEITNLSLALTGADQEPRNKAYRFEMFEWACFVVLICERYLSLPHYGRYALSLEDESGATPIDDQEVFETPVSLGAEGTDSHWDISRLAGFLELSGSVCRWMAFQLENGAQDSIRRWFGIFSEIKDVSVGGGQSLRHGFLSIMGSVYRFQNVQCTGTLISIP
jgi:hypothetical protein